MATSAPATRASPARIARCSTSAAAATVAVAVAAAAAAAALLLSRGHTGCCSQAAQSHRACRLEQLKIFHLLLCKPAALRPCCRSTCACPRLAMVANASAAPRAHSCAANAPTASLETAARPVGPTFIIGPVRHVNWIEILHGPALSHYSCNESDCSIRSAGGRLHSIALQEWRPVPEGSRRCCNLQVC